jgi:hypothetical protein
MIVIAAVTVATATELMLLILSSVIYTSLGNLVRLALIVIVESDRDFMEVIRLFFPLFSRARFFKYLSRVFFPVTFFTVGRSVVQLSLPAATFIVLPGMF